MTGIKSAGIVMGVLLLACSGVYAQQPHAPMHHDRNHAAAVDKRGDMAMGFDHTKTAHHFRLFPDGGAITVETNDPKDAESREAIQRHLRKISAMFAAGNFDLPMFIHATQPPGMQTMKRLKKQITYPYEPMPDGAQVRIRARNKQAVAAIHKFLRFQIQEHRTADPLTIQPEGSEKKPS